MKTEKKYVLYMHTRKNDGGIFYIGIGNKNRPKDKIGRSDYWNKIVKKYDYNITILVENLSWEEACDLEIKMIAFYGRVKPNPKNLNYGCLCNLTDGGEGTKGRIVSDEEKIKIGERSRSNTIEFIHKSLNIHGEIWDYSKTIYVKNTEKVIIGCNIHGDYSQSPRDHLRGNGCPKCGLEKVSEYQKNRTVTDEFRELCRQKALGRKATDETKKKMSDAHKGNQYAKGFKHSEETKKKVGFASKGRTHTEESKKKMSDAQKGKPKTEEHKANISKSKSYGNHRDAKIVLDIMTGIYYECIKEAAELYGIPKTTLNNWLKNPQRNKTTLVLV